MLLEDASFTFRTVGMAVKWNHTFRHDYLFTNPTPSADNAGNIFHKGWMDITWNSLIV